MPNTGPMGLLILPAVALAIAGGASAHAASTKTVTLKDIAFKPARVTITHGDSVRFSWRDGDVPHDVTSTGKRRFRSAKARTSGTHTVRFAKAGTYTYVCTIHAGMAGRITVK
jgi:plastocyanin